MDCAADLLYFLKSFVSKLIFGLSDGHFGPWTVNDVELFAAIVRDWSLSITVAQYDMGDCVIVVSFLSL